MSEDLSDEQTAIQAIYGQQVLRKADNQVCVLSVPQSHASQSEISIRLSFPADYPKSIPEILGTETTGEHTRKGYGKHIVELARGTLQRVFTPGSVCLFELLQELEVSLSDGSGDRAHLPSDSPKASAEMAQSVLRSFLAEPEEEPEWTTSTPITEKKSTFIARACSVRSPQQAKDCLAHLLDTNKRAAKATHNITAYRIQSHAAPRPVSEITYQDCDDDGETAAGGRLLHLLQVMDVWDVLVVVSRWYGGAKLGPDRFSIINNVAREAVLEGGWTRNRLMKG